MANANSGPVQVQLPTGGIMRGFPRVQDETADCAAVVNLETQLAPMLAMLDCQTRILKLLEPLVEIVQGLPTPSVSALQRFASAAAALAPCILSTTPAALLPFVRDLLCGEIRSLKCFRQSFAAASAMPSGPGRENALAALLDSYAARIGTLALSAHLLAAAGITLPQAVALSRRTDPESLSADDAAVQAFIDQLTMVTNALGGCARE